MVSPGESRPPRPLLARASWTFGGQVVSSGSNFVVSLLVLTTAGRREFGAFAVALTVYLLVTQLARSTLTLPVLMLYSEEDEAGSAAHQAGPALALTVLTGAAGSIVLLLIASALDTGWSQFLVLAACLPALEYQDAVRHVAFAAGEPRLAALSDGLWLTLQVLVSVGLMVLGHASPASLFLAWTASGSLSGILFGVRLRARPRWAPAFAWLREHAALCLRLLVEFLLTSGTYYVLSFGLAVIAGATELGRLRAAQSLMGPVSVLLMGGNAFGVPESMRAREDSRRLWQFSLRLSGLLAALALLGGPAVYIVLPWIGPHLFVETWESARSALPLLTVYSVALGWSTGAMAALRAKGLTGWIVRARGGAGAVAVALGLPASVGLGANGMLLGMALSECGFATASWTRLRRSSAVALLEPEGTADLTPPTALG